jgi:hypothetical protein
VWGNRIENTLSSTMELMSHVTTAGLIDRAVQKESESCLDTVS